jgi:tripartite-type tricarboxylate transporter receptor subunit TctC
MSRLHQWTAAVLAAAFVFAAPQAPAQAYPDKPVRLLHGFAAGGNADTVARLVGTELAKQLGQPFVIEPKSGAGGTVAADAVAKAKPDGYTLLLATGGHAITAAMYAKLPYDPVKSFQPVSTITSFPFLFVVNASSAHTNMAQMLAAAKAKPGAVNYGTAGMGTGQHMTGALLAHTSGVALTHIPYRGESAAIAALLGKEIELVIAAPTAVWEHIKAGKLRSLGTSEVRSWTALLAPAGTPAPVIERLNSALKTVLADPSVRARLEESTGGTVAASTPAELRQLAESDVTRWVQLVRDAKIPKE